MAKKVTALIKLQVNAGKRPPRRLSVPRWVSTA